MQTDAQTDENTDGREYTRTGIQIEAQTDGHADPYLSMCITVNVDPLVVESPFCRRFVAVSSPLRRRCVAAAPVEGKVRKNMKVITKVINTPRLFSYTGVLILQNAKGLFLSQDLARANY